MRQSPAEGALAGSATRGSEASGGAPRTDPGTLRAAGAVWSKGMAPMTTGAFWPAATAEASAASTRAVNGLSSCGTSRPGPLARRVRPGVARKWSPGA